MYTSNHVNLEGVVKITKRRIPNACKVILSARLLVLPPTLCSYQIQTSATVKTSCNLESPVYKSQITKKDYHNAMLFTDLQRCDSKKSKPFFFFLISKGNFIQELYNESPEYIGSIQQGANIIKYINYKHPSNHRSKK